MKKACYILAPLAIYYLLRDGLSFVFAVVLAKPLQAYGNQTISAMLTMGSMVLAISVVAWYDRRGKKVNKENIKNTKGVARKDVLRFLGYGIEAVSCAVCLNVILLQEEIQRLLPGFAPVAQKQGATPLVPAILLFGLVSPVVEEYLFRGILLSRLQEVFSKPLAIVLSALFFGVFHGNALQGIYGFLMGLYLALIYEEEKERAKNNGLTLTIFCHGVVNLVVFFGGKLAWFSNLSLFWVSFGVLVLTRIRSILYTRE